MLVLIKSAVFLIAIAIFMYLVVDNIFYLINKRKNI
jgi:hypothetical protein